MNAEVQAYNEKQNGINKEICHQLCSILYQHFAEAENKIWHRHPVWFLDGNPIVGYSKLKAGIRMMFWSGVSFEEERLRPGSGKFKDASIMYTSPEQINESEIKRWINKGRNIQWDYKNIYKRKGNLIRLK